MLVAVDDVQLEWHPTLGLRSRYKLATEPDWSGWQALGPAEHGLTALLLSGQPLWYNLLTGTLCVGNSYAAAAADLAPAADIMPLPTPNANDDDAAKQEETAAMDADSTSDAGAARALAQPLRLSGPWRTAGSLLALLNQVNRRYPNRSKVSDGTIGDAAHQTTNSDHNPHVRDGSMGVVTALDITHDPARGCDAGRLAQALIASRDSRLKYVIWNRRIATAGPIDVATAWTWRPYNGTNPHDHHVHISVQPNKTLYDAVTPWAMPS
ncbi:hypothetical protein [Hymenobacter sp. CRA2]|uniref:hypothetical protein n=1 Tax=Hymenobacter sp. CRA2 TaxID=1955620 RepID=UPI001C378B14|nr:hypothetical protein [Hymenobacter sp. CRA2]